MARLIRSHGFDCERTGRNGRTSEDVTHSIPGVHIEAKRDERLSVDAMVRQAERDAADGLVPVVMFRRNRQPWRVVVDANEYLRLKAVELLAEAHTAQWERYNKPELLPAPIREMRAALGKAA